jgi:seryl-tRNA synthetase
MLNIPLDIPVAADSLSEAGYWLYFASPDVLRYHIDPVGLDRLQVWVPDGADDAAVTRKIRLTLDRLQSSVTAPSGATQRRRVGPVAPCSAGHPFDLDDAVDGGLLRPLGLADMESGALHTALTRAFDTVFRRLGTTMGAQERHYSTLLPIDFLERCRYFDAFPQNIMYSAVMTPDGDEAEQFVAATLATDGKPPRDYVGFAQRSHVLAPAACFHVYLANTDEVLPDVVITTLGQCYRYEGRNASLAERLWDFRMREIVFLGSPGFVRSSRESTMNTVLTWLDRWELRGVVEPGHDPFFLRGDRPECELDPNPKFELRLDLPYRHGDFACASFNISGTFFGVTSNITRSDGGTAWTGCTAFGIDRWAWAVLAQHGSDPDRWPDGLRQLLREAE